MSHPPTISRVRVRYAETDKMGVVYYANYFVWFEVGRTDLLRASGWTDRDRETEGAGLPGNEANATDGHGATHDGAPGGRGRGNGRNKSTEKGAGGGDRNYSKSDPQGRRLVA